MGQRKVIDGDIMKVLESFDPTETVKMIEKYEAAGKWDSVNVDIDGDIILYEDED